MEKSTEKRPDILTDKTIKKEFTKLKKLFANIDHDEKKTLVFSLLEEAAFLKVALTQAKEELKAEGLTTETKNASQRFIKAHPSTAIYEKYSKQYTAIINSLIEHLPPKEKVAVSRLTGLRGD